MSAGTCRMCECTEEQACAGGCRWVDESRTLCSACDKASEIAAPIVAIVGTVLQRQKRKTAARWDLLTAAEQQLVVMSCRGFIEGIAALLTEDAVAASVELGDLAHFLEQEFPEDTRDQEETVSGVVKRLLAPRVGGRIVLPPGVHA